jgi:hypothetical protein
MSDMFDEVTGHTLAAEEAGPLGPESSHGADLPAAGSTAIAVARQQAIVLSVNPDFKITSAPQAHDAGENLGKIKGLLDRMEKERKARIEPLRDQINTINSEYTDPNTLLWEIERKIKAELLVFRNAEQARIDEQRRLELITAERERVRLEQQAQQDRDAAARRAAKLQEQGREAQAASVLRTGEANAQAKERTAALVAAPMQATAPTRVAGVSVRKTWKAKVVDLRVFLGALATSPYKIEEFVTINQRPLDRLAASLQDKMDEVFPGAIAWEDEGIAARSK